MLTDSRSYLDFRASESYFGCHTKRMTTEEEIILEKKRELEKTAVVTHLSLVGKPANRKGIIMKADFDEFAYDGFLMKYDESKGLVYVTNYEPNVTDSQGDFASASTIEYWCHDFLKSGRQNNIDFEHNYDSRYGTLVENFIKRGDDPMFPNVAKESWCGVIALSELGKSVAPSIHGISFSGFIPKKKSEEDQILKCRISQGHLAHRIIN
jgi:Putative phage serine protease XkdF